MAIVVERQIDARCRIETDRIAGVELLKYFEPEAGDRNRSTARTDCRLDFEIHLPAAIACGRRDEFDPRRIARRCPRALTVRTFERHIADTACGGEAKAGRRKGECAGDSAEIRLPVALQLVDLARRRMEDIALSRRRYYVALSLCQFGDLIIAVAGRHRRWSS